MKKRIRILILGVAMMLIMAMSGCGVNHKSPEGVVEALIKNYLLIRTFRQCQEQLPIWDITMACSGWAHSRLAVPI